jgi:hypothetical protein
MATAVDRLKMSSNAIASHKTAKSLVTDFENIRDTLFNNDVVPRAESFVVGRRIAGETPTAL